MDCIQDDRGQEDPFLYQPLQSMQFMTWYYQTDDFNKIYSCSTWLFVWTNENNFCKINSMMLSKLFLSRGFRVSKRSCHHGWNLDIFLPLWGNTNSQWGHFDSEDEKGSDLRIVSKVLSIVFWGGRVVIFMIIWRKNIIQNC